MIRMMEVVGCGDNKNDDDDDDDDGGGGAGDGGGDDNDDNDTDAVVTVVLMTRGDDDEDEGGDYDDQHNNHPHHFKQTLTLAMPCTAEKSRPDGRKSVSCSRMAVTLRKIPSTPLYHTHKQRTYQDYFLNILVLFSEHISAILWNPTLTHRQRTDQCYSLKPHCLTHTGREHILI